MRYLPLTADDRAEMLKTIGAKSVDDFYADVPEAARLNGTVEGLPDHQGELAVERHMSNLAAKNRAASSGPFFVGAGAYKHHVPATVDDGSTACAEAAVMATRATRRKKVVLSGGLHPHYAAATKLLCEAQGIEVVQLEHAIDGELALADAVDDATACVIGQSPNTFGTVTDLSPVAEAAHGKGALLVSVFTEAVSLGLVTPPGEMGADIAVGEGQSIGNGLNFGGPYVGLFACTQKLVRQMPGRLCGETVDAEGKRGFVLTLSTREQHIRRDKATSNICTNSGLCALAFTAHMTLLGGKGMEQLAVLNHEAACDLADALAGVPGVEILTPRFFNEFAFRTPVNAEAVLAMLDEAGIVGGVRASRLFPGDHLGDVILCAATECTTPEDIAAYAAALKEIV